MAFSLRKLVLRIHLYVALATGLVLVAIGLSGSVLVVEEELDHALNPALWRVEPAADRASIEAVLEAATTARPGQSVTGVRLPQTADEAAVVTVGAGLAVHVDPYRAAFLGARMRSATFAGVVFDIHVKLLAGEVGAAVVAASTLLLLVLIATGLYLWWPRRGKVWQALGVRWRAPFRRVIHDVHGASGAWSATALLAIALSGAFMAYSRFTYPVAFRALGGAPGGGAPARSSIVEGSPGIGPDEALARGAAALPFASPTLVALPKSPADAYTITARFPEDTSPNGQSRVHLDRYTGAVLRVDSSREARGGAGLIALARPIHTGQVGGAATRVIAFLASLALVVQAVTGALLWWKPRKGPQ